MERQTPTVTLDRSLAHFVTTVDLDFDLIAEFYENLPFPNKPSLADCRIHISCLLVQRGTRVVAGVNNRRKLTNEYDPLAPPESDILIFLGSVKAIRITLAEAIGHELAHYANPTEPAKKTPEVMAKEREIWFYRSGQQAIYGSVIRLVLATILWLIAGLAISRGLRLIDWLVLQVVSVVVTLLFSPRRRRRIQRLEHELHETYKSLEGEQTAFAHAHLAQEAASFTMRAKPKHPIVRPGIGHRRQNQIADIGHRQMCFRPPRGLPSTPRRTAGLSHRCGGASSRGDECKLTAGGGSGGNRIRSIPEARAKVAPVLTRNRVLLFRPHL